MKLAEFLALLMVQVGGTSRPAGGDPVHGGAGSEILILLGVAG
jgi:hypothetical protein